MAEACLKLRLRASFTVIAGPRTFTYKRTLAAMHDSRTLPIKGNAMKDVLERRIKQMHAAFDALKSADLSTVESNITKMDNQICTKVDFNEHSNPIALLNAAEQLTANIASIKDHLRAWCRKNGKTFNGETLINSKPPVAIIHDLWNVQKHSCLDKPSRSGFTPELRNLATALQISVGSEEGASAFWQLDPSTGKMTSGVSGSGSLSLTLTAQIFDEAGTYRGQFRQTCEEAAEAWMIELKNIGVLNL